MIRSRLRLSAAARTYLAYGVAYGLCVAVVCGGVRMTASAPSSPFMIDAAEVRRMLAAAIGAAGSQKAWAKGHGMSTSYVHEVLRGTRDPGPAVLEALGLERVVGYRQRV